MSLPPDYFDRLYEQDGDPWSFRTRWYEARKRDLTLAVLRDRRYRSAFEPGCSIGVVTQELAARCDRVLAMDPSAAALARAAASVPPNVELALGSVPADWPRSSFDLVVLSEVAYYLDRDDCRALAGLAAESGHEVVAVHWRHPVDDYPLSGDTVHGILAEAAEGAGLAGVVRHVEEDFLLEVWSRDRRSVARRTGVVAS